MANIIGTILKLNDFLSDKRTPINVDRDNKLENVFTLEENRQYVIPDFQREIRWSKENLIELMLDIKRGSKFLGNVIISEKGDGKYEIIDGQQRITSLLMLLNYIRNKFGDDIEVLKTCRLDISSFLGFSKLFDKCFDENALGSEMDFIEETDDYKQMRRYIELWNEIEKTKIIDNETDASDFHKNLIRCELNIIISKKDSTNYGMEYFLDVNLKGVKLDTEDIFKGYLFSNDNGDKVREAWKNLKKEVFILKNDQKIEYPIMKFIEHYIYTDLFVKIPEMKNIQFGEDFLITKEIVIKGQKKYSGEHLIKVINKKSYMLSVIENVYEYVRFVNEIVGSTGPTKKFKNCFGQKIDNDEIFIIHNIIKKIIMDKDLIPKMIVMKYLVVIMGAKGEEEKEVYRNIYGVYMAAVLFTIFADKKSREKVTGIVKGEDWYKQLVENVKGYFEDAVITERQIMIQYKLAKAEKDENYQFRCKSLATIYNYFAVQNNKIKILNGKTNELKNFLSDDNQFSMEHLIINNGATCNVVLGEESISYTYAKMVKRFANSLFNFIFIPKTLNSSLDNLDIVEKMKILKSNLDQIKCEYSKKVIDLVQAHFIEKYPQIENISEVKPILDRYYEEHFKKIYFEYAKYIVEELARKMK